MFRVKISVATYEFGQDLRTALQTAMRIGAQGVQFDLRNQVTAADYGQTARRQLLNAISERALVPASAHFALKSSLFENERLEERLDAVRNAMVFASQLKLRVLTIRMGRLPQVESSEYTESVLPILCDLASHANHVGVQLCIIPAGDSAESLVALLNQIKSGPVGIDGDLASWVLSGRSPQTQLRELNQLISHIEIRDAVRDVDGIGEEVPVGRGEIDWDEVAGLIGEMDYAGWLNVRRSSGNDKIGDCERAIKYLHHLIPMES